MKIQVRLAFVVGILAIFAFTTSAPAQAQGFLGKLGVRVNKDKKAEAKTDTQQEQAKNEPATNVAPPNSRIVPDSGKVLEAGIYVTVGDKLEQVVPTPVLNTGFSGKSQLKSGFTQGLKSMPLEAEFNGAQASIRVAQRPEFYFHGAFDPNEFALVKMKQESQTRKVKVGSSGGFGGFKQGLDKKNVVPVQITRLETGGYRMVPSQALESGEYGFIHVTSEDKRMWTFGVDR
jgi:hypothetical protein